MNYSIQFFNTAQLMSRPGLFKELALMLKALDNDEHPLAIKVYGEFPLPENDLDYLRNTRDAIVGIAFDDNSNVVGCSIIKMIDYPARIEIQVSGVYVKPDHRKNGLGGQLVNQAITGLKNTHTLDKPLVMTLKVFSENEAALRLYARLGFTNYMVQMSKPI